MTPKDHRRLILTRHAKSSWDDPTVADHVRGLNARGHKAALDLGQWLASRDYLPDQVLCSDARRTAETWAGVSKALADAPEAALEPALYQASGDLMLQILRAASGTCVIMLGHNPGISELADMLPAEPPHHPLFARYPTAATLVIDFEIGSWSDLKPMRGSVLDFYVPEEGT